VVVGGVELFQKSTSILTLDKGHLIAKQIVFDSFNMTLNSKHLALRITKYGLENQSFSISKLKQDLQLTDSEETFVLSALRSPTSHTDNPNHIICVFEITKPESLKKEEGGIILRMPYEKYTLTPTALYNYIDYLEIVEARKVANEAKKQSSIALQITVWSIIISTLFGLAGTILVVIQIIFDHFK